MEDGKELSLEDLQWVSGGELNAKSQLELTMWAEFSYLAGITLEQAKAQVGSKMTDEEYEYLKSIWFAKK